MSVHTSLAQQADMIQPDSIKKELEALRVESSIKVDGKLDELTQHFIGMIGAITLKQGFDTIVEGVKMDLWKERIWAVVENAGLLPAIAWKDELEMEEIRDSWSDTDNEFDTEEFNDDQIYNQLTNG